MGYFRKLLEEPNTPRPQARTKILQHISTIISEDQNKLLLQPITLVGLEEAMNQMADDKAPGLDGFTTNFFHIY